MPRTTIALNYTMPYNQLSENLSQILASNGYKLKKYNDEYVFKKGIGMLTAMKFIKIDYYEHQIYISAFISVGIGSWTGAEKDLNGFVGAIPKKQLQSMLQRLQSAVY